jgi:hypothetical protein
MSTAFQQRYNVLFAQISAAMMIGNWEQVVSYYSSLIVLLDQTISEYEWVAKTGSSDMKWSLLTIKSVKQQALHDMYKYAAMTDSYSVFFPSGEA